MASLFLMEGDGADIHRIGFNTLFEGRSSLLADGRVLYSRWEYVDKHFSSAYGLWTANPDGTGQTLLYGGLTWQPGAMLVVDPHQGNDGPRTWIRTWPADARSRLAEWNVVGRVGSYDSFTDVRPKYAAPGCLAVSAAVDAVVGVFVLVECEEPVAP